MLFRSQERLSYYSSVCESLGLNPLTRPFEYIQLNGKLTLYARKDCADQLRALHNVSVTDLTESEREGVFVVTAKVQNGSGRQDAAKGAVSIKGLSGDALANALMKAETKAKRRATLSICGLGMLDETEVETVPGARVVVETGVESLVPPGGSQDESAVSPSDADSSTPSAGDETPWPVYGKFSGQPINSLTDNYLNWFLDKFPQADPELRQRVKAELARRGV